MFIRNCAYFVFIVCCCHLEDIVSYDAKDCLLKHEAWPRAHCLVSFEYQLIQHLRKKIYNVSTKTVLETIW